MEGKWWKLKNYNLKHISEKYNLLTSLPFVIILEKLLWGNLI